MCDLDEKLLQEYIDLTLKRQESIILEEHLSICPECQAYLNGLKIMDWDLKRYLDKDIEVPEELGQLRNMALDICFPEEDAKGEMHSLTVRDVFNLQVSTLNNSLMFINLLSGLRRSDKNSLNKKSKKNVSLLRRIIGL